MMHCHDECMSPMEMEMRHHQKNFNSMRELDEFKICITNIVENYIKMIDTKISEQDYKIDKSSVFISTHLHDVAMSEINKMFNTGEITVEGHYDESTETLYLITDVKEIVITNFYYNDVPFVFVEGMTWREYIESVYNVDNHFTISNNAVMYDSDKRVAHLRSLDNPSDYGVVSPSDTVKTKALYIGV